MCEGVASQAAQGTPKTCYLLRLQCNALPALIPEHINVYRPATAPANFCCLPSPDISPSADLEVFLGGQSVQEFEVEVGTEAGTKNTMISLSASSKKKFEEQTT